MLIGEGVAVGGHGMQGKVTLEDHFAIEATLGDSQPFGAHVWPELRYRLLDFHDQRLRLMDASGVEIMIAPSTPLPSRALPRSSERPISRGRQTTRWRPR
jgi:hypothetical protein